MTVVIKILSVITLLVSCLTVNAETLTITAAFVPTMDNPENNEFINTTPQTGHCATWPQYCDGNKTSISMNVTTKANASSLSNAEPDIRDHVYFLFPPLKEVELINNVTGEKSTLDFSFSNFSTKMWYMPSPGDSSTWGGSTFGYPNGGCSRGGSAVSSTNWYSFIWDIQNPTNPTACYKKFALASADISSTYMAEFSFGYILKAKSPLSMSSGTYSGSVTYRLGPGMDIDFGNKWTPNDDNLTINFFLTVNHELVLTSEAQTLSLQPCSSGNICSQEQGKANWERWMITRITPELTGKSHFSLSSSGSFTTYLQCEYQIEDNCALKSDNSAQQVPVEALLTLSENIVDSVTGNPVTRKRLKPGKDKRIIFETRTFGQNKPGSIDFLVKQRDVDTMLTTRPDTYRGAVTVIFDAAVY